MLEVASNFWLQTQYPLTTMSHLSCFTTNSRYDHHSSCGLLPHLTMQLVQGSSAMIRVPPGWYPGVFKSLLEEIAMVIYGAMLWHCVYNCWDASTSQWTLVSWVAKTLAPRSISSFVIAAMSKFGKFIVPMFLERTQNQLWGWSNAHTLPHRLLCLAGGVLVSKGKVGSLYLCPEQVCLSACLSAQASLVVFVVELIVFCVKDGVFGRESFCIWISVVVVVTVILSPIVFVDEWSVVGYVGVGVESTGVGSCEVIVVDVPGSYGAHSLCFPIAAEQQWEERFVKNNCYLGNQVV